MRPIRRLSLLVVLVLALLAPAAPASAAPPPLPTSMASVGDSITRAFNATFWGCLFTDCPANSWSTGTSSAVLSHSRQLAAKGAALTARTNYARTGAKVVELADQMSRAATAQYVTVLIGANDLCTPTVAGMTSVADFESRFRAGLAAYFSRKGPTEGLVFVSSIPDLDKLRKLGPSISGAVSTWTRLGICQSMLNTRATTADLDAVRAREAAFNGILQQECEVYVGRCRHDAGATFDTAFTRSDISTLDYFHPSLAGQNKLASVTWAAGWWRPGA